MPTEQCSAQCSEVKPSLLPGRDIIGASHGQHLRCHFCKKQVFAECLEVLKIPTEAVDNSISYNKPCSFPCCLHVSQHTPLINVRVVSFHTGVTSASIKPTGNIDHVCNVRQRLDSASHVSSMHIEQEGPHRWSKTTTWTAKYRKNYGSWHIRS